MDQGFRAISGVDECSYELTRMLFELWDELRGNRRAPLASNFDYLHRPELLDHLIVTKVLLDPLDFETKYFGNNLFQVFNKTDNYRTVNDVFERTRGNPASSDFIANSVKVLETCYERRSPVVNGPRQLDWVEKNFIRYESLTVPFGDDEGVVTQLASVLHLQLV